MEQFKWLLLLYSHCPAHECCLIHWEQNADESRGLPGVTATSLRDCGCCCSTRLSTFPPKFPSHQPTAWRHWQLPPLNPPPLPTWLKSSRINSKLAAQWNVKTAESAAHLVPAGRADALQEEAAASALDQLVALSRQQWQCGQEAWQRWNI